MTRRCAIYARVSRDSQNVGSQMLELRKYCEQRGYVIFNEFIDEGVSGAVKDRPALNELMNGARKRRFDIVLVFRFDRFARSTQHLLSALEEFGALGIDFISFQENIDTTTPLGKALFTIVSAIATLERDIIRSRVVAGVAAARAKGKRIGRPRSTDHEAIRQLRAKGLSLQKIADKLGVSKSTVRDVVRKRSPK